MLSGQRGVVVAGLLAQGVLCDALQLGLVRGFGIGHGAVVAQQAVEAVPLVGFELQLRGAAGGFVSGGLGSVFAPQAR